MSMSSGSKKRKRSEGEEESEDNILYANTALDEPNTKRQKLSVESDARNIAKRQTPDTDSELELLGGSRSADGSDSVNGELTRHEPNKVTPKSPTQLVSSEPQDSSCSDAIIEKSSSDVHTPPSSPRVDTPKESSSTPTSPFIKTSKPSRTTKFKSLAELTKLTTKLEGSSRKPTTVTLPPSLTKPRVNDNQQRKAPSSPSFAPVAASTQQKRPETSISSTPSSPATVRNKSSPMLFKASSLPVTSLSEEPLVDWSIKDSITFSSSSSFSAIATSGYNNTSFSLLSRYLTYYCHPYPRLPKAVLTACNQALQKSSTSANPLDNDLVQFWQNRKADWIAACESLFGLLLDKKIPCFYILFDKFTLLATASTIANNSQPRIVINKTTEAFRRQLQEAGVQFTQPFKPINAPLELIDTPRTSVVVTTGETNIKRLMRVVLDTVGQHSIHSEQSESNTKLANGTTSNADQDINKLPETQLLSSQDDALSGGSFHASASSQGEPAATQTRGSAGQADDTPAPPPKQEIVSDLPVLLSPVLPFLNATVRQLTTKTKSAKAFKQDELVDEFYLELSGPITPATLLPLFRILAAEKKEFQANMQTNTRTCWLNICGDGVDNGTAYSADDERTIRLQQNSTLGLHVVTKVTFRDNKYESCHVCL